MFVFEYKKDEIVNINELLFKKEFLPRIGFSLGGLFFGISMMAFGLSTPTNIYELIPILFLIPFLFIAFLFSFILLIINKRKTMDRIKDSTKEDDLNTIKISDDFIEQKSTNGEGSKVKWNRFYTMKEIEEGFLIYDFSRSIVFLKVGKEDKKREEIKSFIKSKLSAVDGYSF